MHKVWIAAMPHKAALEVLVGKADIIGPAVRPDAADSLVELESADAALVSAPFPGTTSTFELAKRLKAVCKFGIGYDNIDINAATDCGICVTNTPDAPTEATAEFTIGVMLDVSRRICFGARGLSVGYPPPVAEQVGKDLAGQKLGLVGLGRIGGRVAEIAGVLRMEVFAYDPYVAPERAVRLGAGLLPDLNSLLEISDVVSLHVPLSPATRGLIGADEMARMKPGSILLNISRGAVVVESALVNALRSGHLGGAGLDVWDPEVPDVSNPLLHMDNVVATPHMAGQSEQGRAVAHSTAATQALMILSNEWPPHLLNPEVWSRRRV